MAESIVGRGQESVGTLVESLLDALPDAAVITQSGHIVHVNRGFSILFGYSASEIVGEYLQPLVVPAGLMHETEMILHAIEAGGRMSVDTVRETRWGQPVEVRVQVSPVTLGDTLNGLLVLYRDISSEVRQRATLEHVALHDPLTGLANRALFLDRVRLTLARLTRRPDRHFAVIFLDLDGFKLVNDRLGHAAGDRLLQEIGGRLRKMLRPQDTIARFGGDEFALLLDERGDAEEIGHIAERLQREIARPVAIGDAHACVSASIGISSTLVPGRPPSSRDAEQIIREADLAMYQAKSLGKAQHVLFSGGELPGTVEATPAAQAGAVPGLMAA